MNDLVKFADLVRSMREWQKTYFKTRSPHALKNSIHYEKLVDAQLAIIVPFSPPPSLF